MADTLRIANPDHAPLDPWQWPRKHAFRPGALCRRACSAIAGLIPSLLIVGAPIDSRAASIAPPVMSAPGCLAIPDPVSREACLGYMQVHPIQPQATHASPAGSAPLQPPSDRDRDAAFCRGDAACTKQSRELQTAADCVDLRTTRNLWHGSEALAASIANDCLSEWLAAASEQIPVASAAAILTKTGQSDSLSIPEIDVDDVCAKTYGHIRIQGIASEAKRCILQMQSSYDGVKSMWNDVTPEMKRECLRRDRQISQGNPYRYQFIYECLDEQISDARRKELLNRDIHFHR
jgi:hypothetical protein